MKTRENKKEGRNFDVTKTKTTLYFFELSKYLIPMKLFKDNIDDICNG